MTRIDAKILVLAGISSAVSIGWADPVVEEIIEKSYPMAQGEKFSIRNDDGSIRIYGADIKEMKLQAIKKAYSKERLSQIAVDVSMRSGELSVETKSPPKPKWGLSDRSGTVDYIIVVPWNCEIKRADLANGEILVDGMRGSAVHANLVNGRLFAHNCFSDLHISVANGGLDVAYEWWEAGKFSLDAEIMHGNARAFIPGDGAFHLQASCVDGQVFSDFTEQEDRQSVGVEKIDMVVGDPPRTEIRVHAVNGSIKIAEANP